MSILDYEIFQIMINFLEKLFHFLDEVIEIYVLFDT